MTPLDRALDFFRDRNLRRSGNGYTARCPAHNDQHASLSISEGDDGKLLIYCHKGCETHDVVRAMGWTMADLMPSRLDGFPSAPSTAGRLPTLLRRDRTQRQEVAQYPYKDEHGALLFQVIRYKTTDQDGGVGKTFKQRHPDGKGRWTWNLNDVRLVPYRLPELLAGNPDAPVFIPEGEGCADAVIKLGARATTNSGGAGRGWRPEYNEFLRDQHIVVLPDNDKPGRDHAQKVAASVATVAASVKVLTLPGLPPKGDVIDWIAVGGTREELLGLATIEPAHVCQTAAADAGGGPQPGPVRTSMSTIAARPVDWLWPGRLPAGAVVTLEGFPAAGKSTMATEIVACVTSGRPLYGAAQTVPRAALWIGHEEGFATALRPRLDAAGADPSLVYVFHDPPSFPADYAWLERQIRETGAAIVIIDPIDAYLDFGPRGDSHRNGDVRARLRDLSVVADTTGASIVMVRHWRKAGGVHAIYRSAGSLAYSAIARAIINVDEDPKDPARRTASWPKMSDAPVPSSIAWEMGEFRRVRWIGDDPRSASELMASADAKAAGRGGGQLVATAVDGAGTWLMTQFEETDTVPVAELQKRALLDGIAWRTVERGKQRLKIEARREIGIGAAGHWVWVAPSSGRSPAGPHTHLPKAAKQMPLAPLGPGGARAAPKAAPNKGLEEAPNTANGNTAKAPMAPLDGPAAELPNDLIFNLDGDVAP